MRYWSSRATSDQQISAAEIAAKYDISLNHLAKVLRSLVRAKLVESVRGAGGGYRFSGNPKRVTLLDVIELFEEVGRDAEDSPPVDQDEGRALHKVLRKIDDFAIASLSSISITTLLKIIEKQKRGDQGRTPSPGSLRRGRRLTPPRSGRIARCGKPVSILSKLGLELGWRSFWTSRGSRDAALRWALIDSADALSSR